LNAELKAREASLTPQERGVAAILILRESPLIRPLSQPSTYIGWKLAFCQLPIFASLLGRERVSDFIRNESADSSLRF
jgi:hypothetical protein